MHNRDILFISMLLIVATCHCLNFNNFIPLPLCHTTKQTAGATSVQMIVHSDYTNIKFVLESSLVNTSLFFETELSNSVENVTVRAYFPAMANSTVVSVSKGVKSSSAVAKFSTANKKPLTIYTIEFERNWSYIPFTSMLLEDSGMIALDPSDFSQCRPDRDYLVVVAMFLPTSAVNVILSAICIVCLCALWRTNAVKYRALSVFPCAISLLVIDLSFIVNSPIEMEWISAKQILPKPYNNWSGAIRCWFIIAACMFYTLNILRYFYLKNMYRVMTTISKKQVSSRSLVLYRRLGSKIVYLVAIAVLFVLYLGLVALLIVFAKNALTANVVIIIACIFPAGLAFLAAILDIVLNWTTIRKHGLRYHFESDSLMFRMEVHLTVPCIIVGILYGIFLSNIIVKDRATRYTNASLVFVVTLVFGILIRLMVSGGLVCIMQIIRLAKRQQLLDISELEQQLLNPIVYEMMYDYCKQEFSLENLLLWTHLQTLKKDKTTVSLSEVDLMYYEFIKPDAPFQVNLPAKTVKNYQQLMQDTRANNQDQVDVTTVINIVIAQLLDNLNDTFSRCSSSDRYIAFRESQRAMEKQFGK